MTRAYLPAQCQEVTGGQGVGLATSPLPLCLLQRGPIPAQCALGDTQILLIPQWRKGMPETTCKHWSAPSLETPSPNVNLPPETAFPAAVR